MAVGGRAVDIKGGHSENSISTLWKRRRRPPRRQGCRGFSVHENFLDWSPTQRRLFFPLPPLCIYMYTLTLIHTHKYISIYIVSSRVPTNHRHWCRHLCHPSDIAVRVAVCNTYTHKSNRFIYFREKYLPRLGECALYIGRS